MRIKVLHFYKIPILISVVLAIIMIAMKTLRPVFDITEIFLGAFIGAFFLDIEFFLYSYLFEPQADFSKTLLGFLKHGDILNALSYINYHKDEIKEKSLNSAVFQIVIGILSISIIFATTSLFMKAITLSIFANSIYRFAESYFAKTTDDWFWSFKTKPAKRGLIIYAFALVFVLGFCLSIFR